MSTILDKPDIGIIESLKEEETNELKVAHLWDYNSAPFSLCKYQHKSQNHHFCDRVWNKGEPIPSSCPICGAPLCDICRTIHDIKGL